MRKLSEQNKVVWRGVGKLLKCIPTCSVGMKMCINRTIPKWSLTKISLLDYFSGNPRWNWTGRSKRVSGSGIDISDRERGVLRGSLSLIEAVIYKRSFTSQGTLLAKLSEAHSESADWAENFEKTEEEFLREVCNSRLLEALQRHSLSDACRLGRRIVRDVLIRLLRNQGLVSRVSLARDMDLAEMKEKLSQAEENLLKRMEFNEEPEISWWRMCTDVSFLQFKEDGCEEHEIVDEERFTL